MLMNTNLQIVKFFMLIEFPSKIRFKLKSCQLTIEDLYVQSKFQW